MKKILYTFICGVILFCSLPSTTYTNIVSLSGRFPHPLAVSMGIAITLSFLLLNMVRNRNGIFTALLVGFMFLSTLLAVNTMNFRETVDAEKRFDNDPRLQKLYIERDNLNNRYSTLVRSQAEIETIISSQTVSGWERGAREARWRSELLLVEIGKVSRWLETVNIEIGKAEQEIVANGSRLRQAVIMTANIFCIPASPETIENFINLVFSIINDTAIFICCVIMLRYYPQLGINLRKNNYRKKFTTVEVEKKLQQFWNAKYTKTAESIPNDTEIILDMLNKCQDGRRRNQKQFDANIKGGMVAKLYITAIKTKTEISQTELGILAAKTLGLSNPIPYQTVQYYLKKKLPLYLKKQGIQIDGNGHI